MQIVPVIDIRNGVVVRAVAGERQNYQPLVTPLAASSAPLAVAQGLLSFHPFGALYIADLDAIERRGSNRDAIVAVAHHFPGVRIWVDCGASSVAEIGTVIDQPNVDVVMGSESLGDASLLEGIDTSRIVLSLDFKGRQFLGPEALLYSPRLWPKRVIAMTLSRVGMKTGPELSRVAHIKAAAPDRAVFAAGGVRNLNDLRQLENVKVAGALIASALHDGALTSADLLALAGK